MSVFPGPRGTSALWSLLPFCLFVVADALDVIDQDPPGLTCSQGLIHCSLESENQFSVALPDPNSSLDVAEMELKATLCRSATQNYKPCLLIDLTLQEEDVLKDISEGSGDDNEERVLVKVCLNSVATTVCRAIRFKPAQAIPNQSSTQNPLKLLLTEQVDFGINVVVVAQSKNMYFVQNITIPPLEEVCSMNLSENITLCEAPRIVVVCEHDRNQIRLQLKNTNSEKEEPSVQMLWNKLGLIWPEGESEMTITSDDIAPCLCFELWWKGKDVRRKYCPFERDPDAFKRMLPHVSLAVVESQVRDRGTALTWNVTSPCVLEADLWLCTKDFEGGHCKELIGSRQKLGGGWTAGRGAHWQVGDFNVSRQPLICVQMKIHGVESNFEPQCPFSKSRVRWILPLLIGFPLMCLAILGAYIAQGILKGYVWKWLKEDDVKGAVGGGHVVLLYPPDENEQDLPGLLCQLGSSLQALGFTVSLDLWSQAELSILGPVPWLHSRLDRLQRQGGKVVLVLTQVTWTRAEEWGALSCSRSTPTEINRSKEENPAGSSPTSCHHADVFGASLSCILADCLQGRAGERFMLVQFESLPPEPPGSFRPLPQLFRGLHVYSLPSQSLGFLTELAGAQRTASGSTRRKRAGGLRMASRALAQKLSGFTAGTNILQLPLMPQGCVGGQDLGETVPLNSCLITDECGPDTNPVVRETEWA
uniref:SEFIR domain-containing protein n=1 Tax=Oryzias latipes TaxID=8090 RepID=A0A3P9LE57_ORYLA